jgi:hypothetical protein
VPFIAGTAADEPVAIEIESSAPSTTEHVAAADKLSLAVPFTPPEIENRTVLRASKVPAAE